MIIEADHGRTRKTALRGALVRDFHIEAAFVGVPKLARILGLAPSTIYAHTRAGTFLIPHRMMNTTTMFLLDDVVDWICSGPHCAQPPGATPESASVSPEEGCNPVVIVKPLLETTPSRVNSRCVSGDRP